MARTIEEAHAICERNRNGKTGERDPKAPLEWDRETATTITSSCGRYRLNLKFSEEDGAKGWFLELCQTPTSAAKHVGGPYLLARDARHAAQCHKDGMALQADLA
jgi:hypothetical protein